MSSGGKSFEYLALADAHAAGVRTAVVEAGVAGAPDRGGFPAAVSALAAPAQSSSGLIVSYVVGKGDSLKKVAKRFNIPQENIAAINPEIGKSGALRVGQTIKIPTIPGMLYRMASGEKADSVAAKYGVSIASLQAANPTVNLNELGEDSVVMIPGVKAAVKTAGLQAQGSSLPDIGNYFTMPAKGYNWGKIHDHNAVDIANSCGTAVTAAAEGLVVPDETFGDGATGWNGGYGHFVLIEHPNGIKTRYAHLGEVVVNLGDYVKQGDRLGFMGNTGNVHGPTGCHLHFEVLGAKNPFARQ